MSVGVIACYCFENSLVPYQHMWYLWKKYWSRIYWRTGSNE